MQTSWSLDGDSLPERREAIRREIGNRVKRVCPDYSEEQIIELVDAMTERQLKAERRANRLLE
jgi:hypothetical protein